MGGCFSSAGGLVWSPVVRPFSLGSQLRNVWRLLWHEEVGYDGRSLLSFCYRIAWRPWLCVQTVQPTQKQNSVVEGWHCGEGLCSWLRFIFDGEFVGVWKPSPSSWCLLHIKRVLHLMVSWAPGRLLYSVHWTTSKAFPKTWVVFLDIGFKLMSPSQVPGALDSHGPCCASGGPG